MSGNEACRANGAIIFLTTLFATLTIAALCTFGAQPALSEEGPSQDASADGNGAAVDAVDSNGNGAENGTDVAEQPIDLGESNQDETIPTDSEIAESPQNSTGNPNDALNASFLNESVSLTEGETVLVGFAPEASDAQSEDESRVEWHEKWKGVIKSENVSLDSLSGWLTPVDDQENAIDYDAILGITTSDSSVLELFGEFPEWKTDDEGTEYRWWYGLLGRAKKPGNVTVSIIYRLADGTNYTSDECTVTVKQKASEKNDDASSNSEKTSAETQLFLDTQAEEESDANVGDGSESTDAPSSEGSGDGSASPENGAVNSGSSSSEGDGAAIQDSAPSSETTIETQESQEPQESQTQNAYPKRVATSTAGVGISAELLVNDEASEQLFQQAANGATLGLTVEAVEKLSDEAEQAISATANSASLEIANRLSIKVVDESGNEVPLSGMQLILNIAADDAVQALDPSSVQAWYVAENGATEQKTAQLATNVLTIGTEHLSDYVIMGTRATSSNTGTNSNTSAANGTTASSGSAATTGTNSTTNGTTTNGTAANASTTSTGKSGLPQTGDLMAYLAVALAFVAGFSASSALNARRRIKEQTETGQHVA